MPATKKGVIVPKKSAASRQMQLKTLRTMSKNNPDLEIALDSYEEDPNPIKLEIVERVLVYDLTRADLSVSDKVKLAGEIRKVRETMQKLENAGITYQVEQKYREYMGDFMQRWVNVLAKYVPQDKLAEILEEGAIAAQQVADDRRDDSMKETGQQETAPIVVTMPPVVPSNGTGNRASRTKRTDGKKQRPAKRTRQPIKMGPGGDEGLPTDG